MTDETQTEETDAEQPDPNEPAFIAGRSRRNAQRALDAADAVEVDQVHVRAVRDGYYAPLAVVEKYAEMLEAEEAEAKAAAEEEAAKAEAEAQAQAAEDATGDDAGKTSESEPEPEAEPVVPLAEGEEAPEDTPAWTHVRLDEFAEAHKIELPAGLNKTDKVAAILAALNTEE